MSSLKFEPVLMIWDFYDGVRTGLAEYGGHPHYFKCGWDDTNDDYSERFELSPIDTDFLKTATTQWEIYRAWEIKFHTGLVTLETHPYNRGINQQYDDLKVTLNLGLEKLIRLKGEFIPEFRPLPNQNHLPKGVLRDLEVSWRRID